MSGPIFVNQEVIELLNALKATSLGIEQSRCNPAAVVLLEDLGLARVQGEDEVNMHPARVKALPDAWITDVRAGVQD